MSCAGFGTVRDRSRSRIDLGRRVPVRPTAAFQPRRRGPSTSCWSSEFRAFVGCKRLIRRRRSWPRPLHVQSTGHRSATQGPYTSRDATSSVVLRERDELNNAPWVFRNEQATSQRPRSSTGPARALLAAWNLTQSADTREARAYPGHGRAIGLFTPTRRTSTARVVSRVKASDSRGMLVTNGPMSHPNPLRPLKRPSGFMREARTN